MDLFKKAVKIIAEGFREDIKSDGWDSLREMFKSMQFDREDYIAEFSYILNESGDNEIYFTDELEIFDGDKMYTLEDVVKAVKAYKF